MGKKNSHAAADNPLLKVKSNSELEKQAALAASRDLSQVGDLPLLTAYLLGVWEEHRRAREPWTEIMLKCRRQREGVYEAEVLQAIRKFGGSEEFMRLTARKCQAAESWIRESLIPADDRPWAIEPTPLPELNPETVRQIEDQAMRMYEEKQAAGENVTPDDVFAFAREMRLAVEKSMEIEAAETARKMTAKLEDQLQEGGFQQAFSGFIADLCTYPAAILKGPVITARKSLKYERRRNGVWQAVPGISLQETFQRVSPFNFYPAPHCACVDDGDIIERQMLTRGAVYEMKGIHGYNDAAIDAVLEEFDRGGLREWASSVEALLKPVLPDGTIPVEISSCNLIEALEFHGSVPGRMLIDWGIEQDIDELREYDIWAILIGRHLIKVELNSSPLGRKPYYTASFERNQDMIWGRGIPQKMEGAQHAANAARRALINNLAISSGPQVTVNTKLLPPGAQVTKIYPWKIWQYKGDGSGAAPFNFFQPQSNASELMEAIERFASEADEDTGIPRYTHGEDKDYYQGAAGTARGLAMLMNAAGKAVKQVIANIDEGVIRPLITALYNYNMLDPSCDPSCKGDLQVKARGAIALSVKEQIQIQRNEFLQLVLNSEIIQQIIGPEGITALLKESVRTLDMPVNSIIPATSPVPSVAPAEVSAEPEAEVIEGTSKAV